MPTATSFDTPLDDRGYPYPAVRPARASAAVVAPASPLVFSPQPTTKVVRICCPVGEFVRVLTAGIGSSFIVGNGIPQDIVVWQGVNLTIVAEAATPSAAVSVLECA